jgi:hypothetical protein
MDHEREGPEIVVIGGCNGLTWVPADQFDDYVRTTKRVCLVAFGLAASSYILIMSALSST